MENIRGQLNLFKDCKAPCIVFAEVTDSIQGDENKPLSKRPTLDNDTWISYCKKINEVGKRLEDEEMPLLIIIIWVLLYSRRDTIRLMQETNDSVKLTIDTGHMLFAGGDYLKIIKISKKKLLMYIVKYEKCFKKIFV